jgi:acyl-CoA reductase-like NAD-dependent aldehyde dehydrogenase
VARESLLHLPILRAGVPYRSLERDTLYHVSTGEPVAEVSQANRGLISRDLLQMAEHRRALEGLTTVELLEICRAAAELFHDGTLTLHDDVTQSPQEFVEQQSSTTGMPQALCRSNMEKIRFVMAEMERVLAGLTRGLDLGLLDSGFGEQDGRTVSYRGETDALGAVLPSNSPGVHSLWIPSLALKTPVVLKPGSREPWTPLRIARAFQEAGLPPEAVSYYPTDHAGATEILLETGRSMLFGDERTLDAWRTDHRVQLHGPGWSKVILDEAAAANWEEHLDLMVASIAENGGRSCVNASGVWAPRNGRPIAEALAARLAGIEALPLDHPDAAIAAFSQPQVAHAISGFIDAHLKTPGAEDLTARHRKERVVEVDGCTFLLPTLLWCSDPAHPLAASELLFPFASVVEVPQAELLDRIGPTLVATAITEDAAFRRALLTSTDVERLNLGPIPTSRVSWDQPHEGNLFTHLYRQRSYQEAAQV